MREKAVGRSINGDSLLFKNVIEFCKNKIVNATVVMNTPHF